MVSGISSSGSDTMQLLMSQMLQKMKAADTDGTAGLSKSELPSIDTGDDKGGANFLSMLSNNFDKIDSDGNGQLSGKEISAIKPSKQPMGPPPGMQIENLFSSADTDSSQGLSKDELASIDTGDDKGASKLVNSFTENFDKLDTNKDGEVSMEELKAAGPGAHGQETSQLAHESSGLSNGTSSNSGNFLNKLSDYILKQLTNAYKSGEGSNMLSTLASSLDLAI